MQKRGSLIAPEKRCQHFHKDGKQCKQYRYQKSAFCYMHDEEHTHQIEIKKRLLAKKIKIYNVNDVLFVIDETIEAVKTEALTAYQGNAINGLLKTALVAIEQRDMIKKLDEAKEALNVSYKIVD